MGDPGGKGGHHATVIIKKVKKGHGEAHHGGAWKVAYADFVTAMMAFFMVMWLVNQNQDVKQAVGGYFRDPMGTENIAGSGAREGAAGVLDSGSGPIDGQSGLLELPVPTSGSDPDPTEGEAEPQDLEQTEEQIRRALASIEGFEEVEDLVEIKQTPEGLLIELMESDEGAFFELGSPRMRDVGKRALEAIAAPVEKSRHPVVFEGHTDSLSYSSGRGYTNWELSADRANAARRVLEEGGLAGSRVQEVRGYAAQRPRHPDRPEDPRNRRVSILLLEGDGKEAADAGRGGATEAAAPRGSDGRS